MPHTFLELLNFVDMDFENPPTPKADYVMLLNNAPASFNDELKDGDEGTIQWTTDN